MKFLYEPLSYKELHNELDLLDGNIARITVSKNPEEVIRSLGFAIDRLSMIAYSRFIELKDNSSEEVKSCADDYF